MRRCAGPLAFAVALFWSWTAAAGDAATAREQLKVGYLLAQEGKCEEAVPHLRESIRLDPKAIAMINLADCEEKLGKFADAMGHWVDARGRAQSEGQRPIEEEAAARLSALEPRLARLTIVLSPSSPRDAVVERDGVVLGAPSIGIALPVDPGAHTIVVRANGRPDATSSVRLGEGEVKRVEVSAGAAPVAAPPVTTDKPSSGVSLLTWAGFGAAGAGVAVGAITGLMALNAGSKAESSCPNNLCNQAALDDIEAGRTLGTVSTVSFIVAGAGVALGIYGLVAGSGTPPRTAAVSVSPAGLRGRF